MLQRMFRALKLDAQLFEEVEHDRSATGQAALVVVIVSVLGSFGLIVAGGFTSVLMGVVQALIGWVIWSFLTFFVGTKLFGGKADMGEMLRALGFAYTPMCLGIVPLIGTILGLVWTIVAFVVAVRQALDFTTGKAIGTVVIGAVVYVGIAIVIGMLKVMFAGA